MSSSAPQQVPADPPSGGSGSPRRPSGLPRLLLLVTSLTVLVMAAVAIPLYLVHQRNQATAAAQVSRVSGIPADVPTQLANLMSLSSLPSLAAPGFTLTDQHGRRLSLSALRGKVVVLQFMDPHCTDICPIVSQESVDAYHDLGSLASKVVFVAINVNQYHGKVSDVAAFSQEHGLTAIPDWHFFTGPVAALRPVWHGYNIEVQAPNPNADIVHTSVIYFIDSHGRERFLAMPEVDHTKSGTAFLPTAQLTSWGHGIALIARHLVSSPGS